jgi:hypothetical protein
VNRTATVNQSFTMDVNGDALNDYQVSFQLQNNAPSPDKPIIDGLTTARSNAELRVQGDLGLPVGAAGETVNQAYQPMSSGIGYFDEDPNDFPAGDWDGGATGYIGLQLTIEGQINFGWAQFTYNDTSNLATASITLIDYAFETTPNVAIITGAVPEPGSLALLVAGATGVATMRRRREVI